MREEDNLIRVLKIEPGKEPYVKEITNDYQASQKEVEGLIDCVALPDGCVAVVNDESKLNGMEPNRRCDGDIICGPFFICGDSPEGEFVSLTDEQIAQFTERFGEIETFTGNEPELEPHISVMKWG